MTYQGPYRGRQTSYRGITMRSRLEARFAAILDGLAIEWKYEPECYADEKGQYLPDFVLEPDLGAVTTVIEVKPRLSWSWDLEDYDQRFDPDLLLDKMAPARDAWHLWGGVPEDVRLVVTSPVLGDHLICRERGEDWVGYIVSNDEEPTPLGLKYPPYWVDRVDNLAQAITNGSVAHLGWDRR